MIDPLLKQSILEYTEVFDKDNIEEISELINSLENTEEVGNEFEVELSGIIGGIILSVLHKRYITDFSNYLPSINSIIYYFKDRYWERKLFLEILLQYKNKKEAKRIANSFFKVFKRKRKEHLGKNNFSFFNPFYFFYNSLKVAFFWFVFQSFYLFSISIKYYNPNVIKIEDDPVFKYMYSNSDSINLLYLHKTFGTNKILFIALFLTFFIFYIIKVIIKNVRNNHLKRKERIEVKTKKKLIKIFPQLKSISIFKYSGINPYVYKTNNNNPCIVIPEKILEDFNSDKSKFIIYHEIYHILNKDYLVNKSILKFISIVFVVLFLVSLLLLVLVKTIGLVEIDILFYVVLYALIIWGFNASNKLIEMRADYYAYLKTKNNNYQSYSKRNFQFFKKFRYPSSKEKKYYIDEFPKRELIFKTIFLLIIVSEISVFFTSGFIPFVNMVNTLILVSLIITFNHISKINLINSLSYKRIVIGYSYWFVSVLFLLFIFMIASIIEGAEYETRYILNEILFYFLPFLIIIPFLILTTKMKRLNYSVYYGILLLFIILNEWLFKDSFLFQNDDIENYPNWLNILFIFGATYFTYLIYSIKRKKPMGNRVGG